MFKKFFLVVLLISTTLLTGCAGMYGESKTTSYKNDACKMFKENPDWLDASLASYKKWGTPISIQLAFIRQESSFTHDIRPIRKNKWYEFGTKYASSALGFPQALDGTWDHYQESTNQSFKDRTSFSDAVDFIGWYNKVSRNKLRIGRKDAYNLYLAYHDGWGGYERKTYRKKAFLKKAARNVNNWSIKYSKQLNQCRLKK